MFCFVQSSWYVQEGIHVFILSGMKDFMLLLNSSLWRSELECKEAATVLLHFIPKFCHKTETTRYTFVNYISTFKYASQFVLFV